MSQPASQSVSQSVSKWHSRLCEICSVAGGLQSSHTYTRWLRHSRRNRGRREMEEWEPRLHGFIIHVNNLFGGKNYNFYFRKIWWYIIIYVGLGYIYRYRWNLLQYVKLLGKELYIKERIWNRERFGRKLQFKLTILITIIA